MPWSDWQVWVVTAAFLVAVWYVARPFLPGRRGPAHGGCAPGRGPTRRGRVVRLTIERDKGDGRP
jgi:hypothetical protein